MLPFEKVGPDSHWGGDSKRGAAMGRVGKRGKAESTKYTLRRVHLDSGGYDQGGAYWGHGKPLYYYESSCGNQSGYFRVYSKEVGIERNEPLLAAYWNETPRKELEKQFPDCLDYIGYLFTNAKAKTRYLAKLHLRKFVIEGASND